MSTWGMDAAVLVQHIVPVLTIWREASGEGEQGMLAVAWVIVNRSKKRGLTFREVCLQPWQFSSMSAKGDPAMMHYPTPGDVSFSVAFKAWHDAMNGKVADDPTEGADFYFAPSLVRPPWASAYTRTASIGRHDFFRS